MPIRVELIYRYDVPQFVLSGRGVTSAAVTEQTGRQLPLHFAPGEDVNVAVNRFVAGVHKEQISVVTSAAASDLLWRPTTMHVILNRRPQRRVIGDGAVPRRAAAGRPCAERCASAAR